MAIIPFKASAEQWRGLFTELAPDLPSDFLIAWLDSESGGNPCATGILTPGKQEAGIFQTMHPQDDRYGATYDQLRQGCSGQTLVDPSLVDKNAQVAGLNLVRDYRTKAQVLLAAGGVTWPQDSSDFWKAVKQVHALPCVLGDLPKVAARLGRPPQSWDEFKSVLMSMQPSEMSSGCATFAASPSHRGLRNRLEDTMHNAEEVGKYGGGVLGAIGKLTGSAGTYAPLMLIGAAGLFAYLLWTD